MGGVDVCCEEEIMELKFLCADLVNNVEGEEEIHEKCLQRNKKHMCFGLW